MKKLSNNSQNKHKYLSRIAWEKGILSWKLRDYQKELYGVITGATVDPNILTYVVNCSRRFGKTFILSLIVIEYAINNPNSQIRFATGTARAIKKIVIPTFKTILEDCPVNLKPKYHTMDMVYTFPNGSEVHLAGTDNGNADNLRGSSSDLNIVDEAGFVDDLGYVINSILVPMTLTTNGTTVMISTPPRSPAHEFYGIALQAKERGQYSEYDITHNTSLSQATIDVFMEEAGGANSSTWRREYMCEFITDENTQLIPEFTDDLIRPFVNDNYYQYYYKYTAMDLGVSDFTAALFSHYDFKKAILYIEDEFTMNGHQMTTDLLETGIREKEQSVFGDYPIHKRISDNNNLLLINDLNIKHNLTFIATGKSTLEAMLNQVRIMVKEGRIVIHPRCEMLIGNLKYGVWDKNRKQFGRSEKYKHYDHLAALVYLVRNIDTNTNPIPATHNTNIYSQHINTNMQTTNNHVLESIFG